MNLRTLAGSVLLLLLTACGPEVANVDIIENPPEPSVVTTTTTSSELRVPKEDRSDTIDIASWNVEWFGDVLNGPTDEAKQQANVARVLAQLDLDLVGLVEVVSEDAFKTLMTKLPGFSGLIVTDPRVVGGRSSYYEKEQKVALVYRNRFTVDSARVVLTEASNAFAGRPPMEVHLSFSENGRPRTLVVIVSHFKAMANLDGYQRRIAASVALKQYLDTEYPRSWVLVVGDLNDDIDKSTYRGSVSPFAPIVTDSARYRFTTDALTTANLSTTVSFSSTIDHHLATNELALRFVEGSAKVLRVDAYVTGYGTNTTDHYPVLTRYDLR